MIKKLLAAFILCAGLSLSCAAQAPGIQFAVGNTSVEKTTEDGTVTKTTGAEMSPPFVDFLKEIVAAAAKLIPGNGGTVVNVNGSDVQVEE